MSRKHAMAVRDLRSGHMVPGLFAVGLAAGLLWFGPVSVGQTASGEDSRQDRAPAIELESVSRDGPPSAAELNEARMLFDELDEQVRISSAKLEDDALARKRAIGRKRTLLAEADLQIQSLAAQIQRMQERREQLDRDRPAGSAGRLAAVLLPYEPVTRLQQRIQTDETRLETLTRHRTRLKQRLDRLYDQHVKSLLEAGLGPQLEAGPTAGALEQLLEEWGY